jgi:hypothetical protein
MSDPTPPVRSPEFTPRRAVISGFIAFNLVAILCTAIPPVSLVTTNMKRAVEPYMLLTGLQQVWAMFSPDPPTFMNYVEAEVTYKDGRTTIWKLPIPGDYGYYQRYFLERYRKWGNDYIRTDQFHDLWPDACRYIARINNTRAVAPDSIRLFRRWTTIPPVDSALPTTPPHWERYKFYNCAVHPEDLR